MAEHNEQLTQTPESSQKLTITLELVTLEDEFDPALLTVVGNDTVAALQQEGYAVLPAAYTGEKGGGSFFVEFVTTVRDAAMAAWDHRAAIEQGLADLSNLITVFVPIVSVLIYVQKAHEKQVGKEESHLYPIKITVGVDGAPLVIEAADLQQAEAALLLARKFQAAHPAVAAQATAKSKAKVHAQIPARRRRSRR